MKKLIIGGIIAMIIAGGIGAGAAFFSNSSPNSSNNSNNRNNQNMNNTGSNSFGNNDNNTQSKSQDTSSNSSKVSNMNNQNENSNNSTNNNQNTFKMNLGNGQFDDLIQSTSFLYGKVSNGARLIINVGSTIENKQLLGTEYYLNKPNEKFNVKISSLGNDKYEIYEFYNGVHTGTYIINGVEGTIQGTYSHAGSNNTINATFYSNNIGGRHDFQTHGLMDNYPFYGGEVAGTKITWINNNSNGFEEHYNGDTNAFKITLNENYQGSYAAAYTETYNDKKTGEYVLNYDSATNQHIGKYIKYVNGKESNTYNVALQGSSKPTY